MNIILPRRKFTKKVRVTGIYGDLKPGDILESCTLRRGNFTGLLNGDPKKKRTVAAHFAELIS